MAGLHPYLSATEVLAGYHSGEYSPRAFVATLRERVDTVEPMVNAVTPERLHIDDAIAESERRLAHGTARPLEGIPVVIKEEQPIEGHTATDGSPMFANRIATETHPVVERIREAGGIPFLRSTTPEFCIAAYTRGDLWGITRNPWHPEYAVGGSSGGSGAALAAGYAPLATGSDIGGSTRIPASFNGVVGYKPPYGRNPALPPTNLDTYCTDGPMARTVADAALLQNVLSGVHPHDPVSLRDRVVLAPNPDLAGKRIGLAVTFGDYGIEPEVAAAIARTAAWLEAAGAQVDEIVIPFQHERILDTVMGHFGSVMIPWIEDEVGLDRLDQLQPYTRQAITLAGAAFEKFGVYETLNREAEVHAVLSTLFARYDAIVCPVAGVPALLADSYYEDGITINGVHYPAYLASMMTMPFNIANRNPVLSVPVGRSSQNIPIGAQVIAAPYDDATVFNVGAAIEIGRGLWYESAENRPVIRQLVG